MENWKAVPGFEGIYEVSDLGRIRNQTRLLKHLLARALKEWNAVT